MTSSTGNSPVNPSSLYNDKMQWCTISSMFNPIVWSPTGSLEIEVFTSGITSHEETINEMVAIELNSYTYIYGPYYVMHRPSINSFFLVYTVQCRCNAINFLQNSLNRHSIACTSGRSIGCLLWVWSLIFVLLLSSQHRMLYRDKLECVITAMDCTYKYVHPTKRYQRFMLL